MKDIIEICSGSVDDVIAAQEGGADRVELNSALDLGGLTPSIGTLRTAKKLTQIPIISMVRPRTGGFCYTSNEIFSMKEDINALVQNGTNGLVFGVLNGDGTINVEANRVLVNYVKKCSSNYSRPIEIVFHRAIDVTPNWKTALETLIELGFDRVLTSGQHKTAIEGASVIKNMIDHASGRIDILPGCGINVENIALLKKLTSSNQFHMSAGETHQDTSTQNFLVEKIPFNSSSLTEDTYKIADPEKIKSILIRLNKTYT